MNRYIPYNALTSLTSDKDEEITLEDVERFITECNNIEPMLKTKFNIFDVLGVSRMEIRHSNILAWLLDPNESHEEGGWLLKEMVKLLSVEDIPEDSTGSFGVYRENEHIDILLVSHFLKRVIAIENKIGAKENKRKTRSTDQEESQLSTYENILSQLYPEYQKTLIYLTPEGNLPSMDNWLPLSYVILIDKVEEMYKLRLSKVNDARRYLVENYIETIRKDVLMQVDENVIKKCREVYNTHRAVLKKILEYGKTNVGDEVKGLLLKLSQKERSPIKIRTQDFNFGLSDLDELYNGCIELKTWWGKEPYVCCVQVDVEHCKVCCNVAVWLEVSDEIKDVVRKLNKGNEPKKWTGYKWLAWNSPGDANKKNWKSYVEDGDSGDTLSEAIEKAVEDVISWAEKMKNA